MNYYNDNDPFCCAVLKERMADGLIPEGLIDDRDFRTIDYRELGRYKQVHLFAGIGGFALAARMAGWPDDRELWTAGFPCQPVSVAGKRLAQEDERWLWPWIARAVCEVRPGLLMLENVPGLFHSGFGDVLGGLAEGGFDAEWGVVSAAAVGAPHLRERVWILAYPQGGSGGQVHSLRADVRLSAIGRGSPADVADAENVGRTRHRITRDRWHGLTDSRSVAQSNGSGRGGREDDEGQGQAERGRAAAGGEAMADAATFGLEEPRQAGRPSGETSSGNWQADSVVTPWSAQCRLGIPSHGLSRNVDCGGWECGVPRVTKGQANRVNRLRALGNSIVPQVAAQILREYMR